MTESRVIPGVFATFATFATFSASRGRAPVRARTRARLISQTWRRWIRWRSHYSPMGFPFATSGKQVARRRKGGMV